MFYNILDTKGKSILPFLEPLKDDFYLAGGTALALQIGHRDNIDFDFFTETDFNSSNIFQSMETIFKDYEPDH